jgi:hypothetical protein
VTHVVRTVNGEGRSSSSEGEQPGEILVASQRARDAARISVPSDAERDRGNGARYVAELGRSSRRRPQVNYLAGGFFLACLKLNGT